MLCILAGVAADQLFAALAMSFGSNKILAQSASKNN